MSGKIKKLNRLTAFILAFVMLMSSTVFADTTEYIYLEGCEVPETITENNLFYIASSKAEIAESSTARYIFSVKRGGDCTDAASVELKISDVTAKYGKDYKIKLHNAGLFDEKVEVPEDNVSLLELMQDGNYTENAILSSDELAEAMQDDTVSGAATELLQGTIDEIENRDTDSGWAVEVSDDEVTEETTLSDLSADLENSDAEELGKSLYGARELYTGIKSDRANPEGSLSLVDTLTSYQEKSDELTNALLGAVLKVDFAEGENEREIEIVPINNSESDGNRIFTIMLSNPSDGYTNSAISNLVATIVDDEPEIRPVVSFAQASYDEEDDVVKVELVREGQINSLVSVNLQTESKTAISGRDFSPVNSVVAFPMGLSKRTIEVPVRGDYLTEDGEFKLYITDGVSCDIGDISEATATVKAEPKTKDSNEASETTTASNANDTNDNSEDSVFGAAVKAYADGEDFKLSAYSTWLGMDTSRRVMTSMTVESKNFNDRLYNSGGSGTHSKEGDYWLLQPDRYKSNYSGFYLGSDNGVRYDIDGVKIDWEQSGSYPKLTVKTDDDGSYTFFSSENKWGRTKDCYNLGKTDVKCVEFNSKTRRAFTRTKTKIYSITPIAREFNVSLQAADKLSFYNASGGKSTSDEATNATFTNLSQGDLSGKLIRYSGETIDVSATSNMARMTKLVLVKNGKANKTVAELGETNTSTTISFKLTNDFIKNNLDYIDFTKDGNDIVGSFTIKPVFEYINKTIRVYKADYGYFNSFGGVDFNITSAYKDYTNFHVGDVIKLTTSINSANKGDCTPDGALISYKKSSTDNQFTASQTQHYINNNYVFDSNVVSAEYVELEPTFLLEDNEITIKVPKGMEDYFDTSVGFFEQAESKKDTNGDMLYVVAKGKQVSYLSSHNFYVQTISDDVVPIWKESKNDNLYSGNVFYYTARRVKSENIITLTAKQVNTNNNAIAQLSTYVQKVNETKAVYDEKNTLYNNADYDRYVISSRLYNYERLRDTFSSVTKRPNTISRDYRNAKNYILNNLTSAEKNGNNNNGSRYSWDLKSDAPRNAKDINTEFEYACRSKSNCEEIIRKYSSLEQSYRKNVNTYYNELYTAKKAYNQAVTAYNNEKAKYKITGANFVFTGKVVYPSNYNMTTGRVTNSGGMPAEGAVVATASGGASCGSDGTFKTLPALYAADTKVRYMVAFEGKTSVNEFSIPSNLDNLTDYSYLDYDTGQVVSTKASILNIGDNIRATVLSNETVRVNSVSVENSSGKLYSVPIANANVTLNARVTDNVEYTRNGLNKRLNAVTTEETEKITAVTFEVYDPVANKFKGSFDAEQSKTDPLLWSYTGKFSTGSDSDYSQGDMLYVKVTSDRSCDVLKTELNDNGKVISKKSAKQELGNYSSLYTGYDFSRTADMTDPLPQQVDIPTTADFVTMPIIGAMDLDIDFPFISVAFVYDKASKTYRVSMGVSIGDFIDKPGGTGGESVNDYHSDNLKNYKDMFTIKHPFKSFAKGIKEAFSDNFKNGQLYSGVTSSLGAPTFSFTPTVGIYFDFGYASYVENGITYSDYILTGGGGYIGLNAGMKMAYYCLVPVVFIPFYFGFELDGSMKYSVGATRNTNVLIKKDDMNKSSLHLDTGLEYNGILEAGLTFSVYCGVGLCGTIGVRGGGMCDMAYIYYPLAAKYYNGITTPHGMIVEFSLGLWVDALLFSIPLQYSFDPIRIGFYKDVANASVKKTTTESGTETTTAAIKANNAKGVQVYADDTEPEVYLREGNSGESVWLPEGNSLKAMSGFDNVGQTTLVENGYERPSSQLIDMGNGKILLAFLDNDNSRGELERSVLKYSIYDGSSWQQPIVVQNDGTADFSPTLADAGDNIAIAWTSSAPNSVKTGDATQYLSTQEIYTALISKATGEVSGITRLTSDDYYDSAPTIMYDELSGDIGVYYIKSELTSTFVDSVNPYTNGGIVTYMLYDGQMGKWLTDYYYPNEVENDEYANILINQWGGQRFLPSAIDELSMSNPVITDLTSISYNGLGVYAYTIDTDNNTETNNDRELFVQVYDFTTHKTYKPVRITNDDVADTIPQFVRGGSGDNEKTYLYWYNGSDGVNYINLSELIGEGINDDGTIKSDYTLDVSSVKPGVNADEMEKSGTSNDMSTYKVVKDSEDNTYIIWIQPQSTDDGEAAQEIFATAFIDDGEQTVEDDVTTVKASWSNAYRLTRNGKYNDEVSGVIDKDGNLMVVHNQFTQTLTDNENTPVEVKDLKLVAERLSPKGEVNPTSVTLSDYTPKAGDTVEVTVKLQNQGLTKAKGYEVTATDAGGNVLDKRSVSDSLVAGAYADYSFNWTVPSNIVGNYVTITAREGGMSNTSELSSEPLSVKADYAINDLNIVQETDGLYAEISVKNNGNTPSVATDKVILGYYSTYGTADLLGIENERFGEVTVGDIAVDEIGSYKVKLENLPAQAFEPYGYVNVCAAVADSTEENWLSDAELAEAVLSQPLEFTVNDGETDVTLNQGDTLDLTASFEPYGRFYSAEVAYSVDDTGVAQVDDDVLTAVGGGDTVVTATIQPYGNTVTLNVHVEGSNDEEEFPEYTTIGELDRDIDEITEATTKEAEATRSSGRSSNKAAATSEQSDEKTTNNVVDVIKEAFEDAFEDAFTDISNHWGRDIINEVAEKNIVSGYSDNTFRPNNSITRAELLTILYNSGLADTTQSADVSFADVNGNEWYADYVKWGAANNLIVGYEDNTFRGNNVISRQEMAVVIAKFVDLSGIEYEAGTPLSFADEQAIAPWARSYVDKASSYGIVTGDNNNCYAPEKALTRAETAVIINRITK